MIEQPPGLSRRLRAFSVHLLTATGAGLALMALFAAAEGRWGAMFGWLGVALLVDAIDGPIARTMRVKEILPHWSGDTLDLVVDFTTYVFVPAYAIAASGFIVPSLAAPLGIAIVMSGALYFVDLRMKTDDNHFRGFPTLWNAAAFYLFLLKPSPWIATARPPTTQYGTPDSSREWAICSKNTGNRITRRTSGRRSAADGPSCVRDSVMGVTRTFTVSPVDAVRTALAPLDLATSLGERGISRIESAATSRPLVRVLAMRA